MNKVLLVLLIVLAFIYGVNIFTTNKFATIFIDKPIEISFVSIPAPDGECPTCTTPQEIIKLINQNHNIKYETTVIEYDSKIGEKYIDMYNISKLPAVIVSGDISNDTLVGVWNSFSGKVKEDRVVIEDMLPFYELSSKSSRGIVDIVLLTDKACDNCFDVNLYLNILNRFNVQTGSIITYDVTSSEGRNNVRNYNIEKIPTILISPEVSLYNELISSWGEIGTIENDGWLVLRDVQKLSPEFKSI